VAIFINLLLLVVFVCGHPHQLAAGVLWDRRFRLSSRLKAGRIAWIPHF
jgi:hypothetical protein